MNLQLVGVLLSPIGFVHHYISIVCYWIALYLFLLSFIPNLVHLSLSSTTGCEGRVTTSFHMDINTSKSSVTSKPVSDMPHQAFGVDQTNQTLGAQALSSSFLHVQNQAELETNPSLSTTPGKFRTLTIVTALYVSIPNACTTIFTIPSL
jgi:hypothetical protein